jgi:2-polyprenyl-6-methoxyphenol hydroxylase-like FAD-dependent oxidoreductase
MIDISQKPRRLRILVVGGSLGGLFAAALLIRSGHDVQIFERSAHGLANRGAGLGGRPELFAILRAVGCEHVGALGVRSTERIDLDLAGSIIARQRIDQMQLSWDYLFDTFRKLMPVGSYVLGREVESVGQSDGSAWLKFNDGTTQPADLIIGADGLGSMVRKAVDPSSAESTYVGYVAWRGLVPEQEMPAAASVLLEKFAMFAFERSHILGYLVAGENAETATGKRRYNWVWYRRVAASDLSATLTDAGGSLHRYSLPPGSVSDKTRRLLIHDAERQLPPPFAATLAVTTVPFVQAMFDFVAERMASGRLVLLGDAAVVVRPHTAMGVAKAAGDALALASCLDQMPLEQALTTYARERLPVGRAIATKGRLLGADLAD